MSESPNRSTTWGTRLGIGLLSLLLLSASYYGIYRLVLDESGDARGGYFVGMDPATVPIYKCDSWHNSETGGKIIRLFFRPAELADRQLRPSVWKHWNGD